MGLLTILGIIFIVLKLVGVIVWSWWLVLLPFGAEIIAWAIAVIVWAIVGSYALQAVSKEMAQANKRNPWGL